MELLKMLTQEVDITEKAIRCLSNWWDLSWTGLEFQCKEVSMRAKKSGIFNVNAINISFKVSLRVEDHGWICTVPLADLIAAILQDNVSECESRKWKWMQK